MSFDFPASPTLNQQFAPAGGPTYYWNGSAWAAVAGSVPTAQSRNRIVNPAFQISQENGNTGSNASGFYFADQWSGFYATTGTITFASLSNTNPGAQPAKNVGRMTVGVADTSIAAGEYARFQQGIEGLNIEDFYWGFANAKKAVLRFDFLAINNPGTYCVALFNGAVNTSYIATFVATTAWQTFTFSIPGPTTGTFATDNTAGVYISIVLAAGATYQAPSLNQWNSGLFMGHASQTNGLGVAGADFRLANVGLYLDPNNTGLAPPFEEPDFATELAKCQRYWHETYQGEVFGQVVSGTSYHSMNTFIVSPRPGVTISGVNSVNTAFAATVGSINQSNLTSFNEQRAANASASFGRFFTVYTVNGRM